MMLKNGCARNLTKLHGVKSFQSASIPVRRFHVIGPFSSSTQYSQEAHKEKKARSQLTLHHAEGKLLSQHVVLKAFRQLPTTSDATKAQSIVLCMTPSYTSWAEDEKFMRGVVSALTASESDIERIKTVVAVIDSISVPGESRSFPEPAEGISMMRYHESNAFPRTVSHLTSQPKTSSQKAAVIFSFHQTIGLDKVGSNGQILEVTLPLANTLFRNGRPSTLLMNTWKRSSEAPATFTIDHASSGTCSACAINPDACSNYADTILPLHRLTEPKQIETGLGNIIRQLRGPSNRAEPASTELEERVVDYLTKNGLPQQSVAVWALVSPNYSDLELERQVQTGQGSLYRVLSGGGGWGAKAGLLSLDPETLPQVSDAETEFSAFSENFGDASDYAQTEKTRALGAIAEPGKFVSFYIGLHGLRDAEGGLHPLLQPSPETSDQRIPSIQLGCAPSRIDDMPSQLNEAEDMSGVLVADNFTAMSESGLFIRLKAQNGETGGEEVLKACKVDIPMAQITATDLP